MANEIVISRVPNLPPVLDANTIYFVKPVGTERTDIVLTGNEASAVGRVVTFKDVEDTAAQAAADAVVEGKSVFVYETYAAMQQSIQVTDVFAFVKDTSGDPQATTPTGSYVFSMTDSVWYRIPTGSGGSGNDVLWTDITGRPSSTPAQIDAAVAASTHTNRAVLNKLGEQDGVLTYGGAAVNQVSVEATW